LRSCAAFRFVFATRNIVTLLEIGVSGFGGVAVGGMAGNPMAGAAVAVLNPVATVIGNDVTEFRLISRHGAFDAVMVQAAFLYRGVNFGARH
jgi:hypothetical protein